MKRPGLDIVLKALKEIPEPVVVDVGAFRGGLTEKFLKANPKAFVYAIEASPLAYQELAEKFKLNVQTVCSREAIVRKTGPVNFYVARDGQGSSIWKTALEQKGQKIKKIRVRGISLDEYIDCNVTEGRIDLLKLNCEGAEYQILKDSAKFLDITGMIYLSLHLEGDPFNTQKYAKKRKNIAKMLKKRGFRPLVNAEKPGKHIWQLWRKVR